MNFHCGIRELTWLYRHFAFVDLLMLNSWLPRFEPEQEKKSESRSIEEIKYEMMRKGFK